MDYSKLAAKMEQFLHENTDDDNRTNCNGDVVDYIEAEAAIQAFIDFVTK